MSKLKAIFIRAISVGSHGGLTEGKKFALQVSVLDAYWSIVAFSFYAVHTYVNNQLTFCAVHLFCLAMMFLGLWLIRKRHYDLARPLIHLSGLFAIFVGVDIYGTNIGLEFYYFVSIMMPNISFSLEELWKAIPLSATACAVFIFQQVYGPGLLFHQLTPPDGEKVIAITFVSLFTLTVLFVVRWRLYHAQRELLKQQSHLIHRSNLVAIGEMAAGLSHEINNPLQTLSLQSKSLKESMLDLKAPRFVMDQFETVDATILRISKLIRSLRDLSRDVFNDPIGYFTIKEMLDEVMNLSSQRIKNHGIRFEIKGDLDIGIKGNLVQISQVLINILNNSIDAVETVDNKWISIELIESKDHVKLILSDSGPGIPQEFVHKIMQPFFTTKGPGKGTGLGLSISKNIIEKNGGLFYFDRQSPCTSFVIELPTIPASSFI